MQWWQNALLGMAGGVGAVIAVSMTLIYNARQERRRYQAERSERLRDRRIELFIDMLSLGEKILHTLPMTFFDFVGLVDRGQTDERSKQLIEELRNSVRKHEDESILALQDFLGQQRQLKLRIMLLCPPEIQDAWEPFDKLSTEAYVTFHHWSDQGETERQGVSKLDPKLPEKYWELREQMTTQFQQLIDALRAEIDKFDNA
ncbi:MAG: hypothetical protein ABWY93_18695 [Mycobacterium sp.]